MTTRADQRKRPGERAVLKRSGAGFSVTRPARHPSIQLRSLAAEGTSDADEELLAAINEIAAYINSEGFVERVSNIILGGSDADAIHDNVNNEIAILTEKSSPVSGDWLLIEDSAASNSKKKAQVGNLPAGAGGVTDQLTHLGW